MDGSDHQRIAVMIENQDSYVHMFARLLTAALQMQI